MQWQGHGHAQISLKAPYQSITGMTIDPRDGRIHVACHGGALNGILALDPLAVVVGSSVAGCTDGTGPDARSSEPQGLAFARLAKPLLAGSNDAVLLVGERAALRAAACVPGSNNWSISTLAGGMGREGFDNGRAAAAAAAAAAEGAAAAPPLDRPASLWRCGVQQVQVLLPRVQSYAAGCGKRCRWADAVDGGSLA